MRTKINTKISTIRNTLSLLIITAIIVALSVPLNAQTELYGPQSPPPKESSITPSHPVSSGQIGRVGGIVYTITNITLANSTTVYWTMLADSVKLSMDGSVYSGTENMAIDAAQTDLPGGIVTWTGATQMPLAAGGYTQLISKFVMTVYDLSANPVALIDPAITGLPVASAGAVLITDNSMVFKVRMEMFVSDNAGSTYTPHLDYYDPAPTPDAAESAYSSYAYGFYWENDPPELTTNLTVNVDERDTVVINNADLLAEDIESTLEELKFILDPNEEGLLPAFGKIQFNSVDMVLPDTISMADIFADFLVYIHDGSESSKDSIPILIFDSDSALYKIGEDSVFYIMINITPVDDPPIVMLNTGVDVDEGADIIITNEMLLTTDAECAADKITYTLDPESVTTYPNNGVLKLSEIPLSDAGTFTQKDIEDGKLVYSHDGTETLSDGFLFHVEDEFGHLATDDEISDFFFAITINPVNDPPVFTKNIPLEVDEGGFGIINNMKIAASDEESGPEEITFTLDPDFDIYQPIYGQVMLGAVVLGDGDSFTMEDVNNSLVSYQHDGGESTFDFIPFSISDPDGGVHMDGEYYVFQLSIIISPVNDVPTLANPIDDQKTRVEEQYNFTFAENTFEDVDEGDQLTYTATLDDMTALPDWISFDGPTRTFSGTPLVADIGMISILITATDLKLDEVTDDFYLEVTDPVGFEASNEFNRISVFPNPFSDQIHLTVSESYSDKVSVRIMNLLGEKILELVENPGSERTIDLSDQPAGIYFISVEDGNKVLIMKMVKR